MSLAPLSGVPFERQRLGAYEVLAPISEGGMASVWLGRATEYPRALVALKVIRPEHGRNKEFIAMFLDEARIASRLAHPNIVTLHGLEHDGKRHFLVMEVLRGRSLLDLWLAARARHVRLGYELVAWVGARVADALHYAHELCDDRGAPQQVVHRDVNPANIFITRDGVPKLIDFGLAKARDRIVSTAVGVVKGKLAYLSPEQAEGRPADRRADVFALGVTLWELSLDRRLFRDDSDVETVRRVREAEVPDPRALDGDYPPALAAALLRALARDPANRLASAAELRDALDAFVRTSAHPVNEGALSAVVRDLSSDRAPAPWEVLADRGSPAAERIRAWDDERQKLTWMNASIETAPPEGDAATDAAPMASATDAAPDADPGAASLLGRLGRLLAQRAATLAESAAGPASAITGARVELEHALVEELLGDPREAARHARASLAAAPTATAHWVLRRLEHARDGAAGLLEHLDAEIADVVGDGPRADLMAERARLLEAAGAPPDAVRAAWERVLATHPGHAAALKGLEVTLREGARHGDRGARDALAPHLARMAIEVAEEPRLAAWLEVERARWLDRALHQPVAAKAALERALGIDSGLGPVRTACVTHAVAHREPGWLVDLLEAEAALETDGARAARLELDAACLARYRAADTDRAMVLLERASARGSASPLVSRHALDELVTLYEAKGRWRDALRVRRARVGRLEDPRARAHEEREMATLHSRLDDPVAAIAALERALELSPADSTIAHELDRVLESVSLDDRRIALFSHLAAATDDPRARARHLVLAAKLSEAKGDRAPAVDMLRAALIAAPRDPEIVDHLLQLLPQRAGDADAAAVRERIAVHAHGAEHTTDSARRVAHLEAIALLHEERLGDDAGAAAAYEAVLRVDPKRRGALLGLARTAARTADAATLARARIDEATATQDVAAADALRVRGAEALATADPARALALVLDVLERCPSHVEARRLEQRLHENAGRWAQVDASIAARLACLGDRSDRVDLWLARAELQRTHLRSPADALTSLRAALDSDPSHPAAREALVAQLEASGDLRALRDGLTALASVEGTSAPERARLLVCAAQVDELRLLDDGHAAELYARALAEAPEDPWLLERLERVEIRRSHAAGAPPSSGVASSAAHAAPAAVAGDPGTPQTLIALELGAREAGSTALVARALAQQADAFSARAAKLGALWSLAALTEWRLPDGDDTPLIARILRLAPTDRAALDAAIRGSIRGAREGDPAARARLVEALRARLAQSYDIAERAWLHLAIALGLEGQAADERRDDGLRAALESYREALRIDPRSPLAAEGAARLGAALGDAEALVAAHLARADLAPDPRRRAVERVGAASKLVSTEDPRLGARPERLTRACEALEQALDADPDALPAAALLVAVRTEQGERDRLLHTLRGALQRATSPQAIARLGAEVSRLAALDPPDRVLAVEALKRVLSVAPDDEAARRALAELSMAQGAWHEAIAALSSLSTGARNPRKRIAALLDLARAYEQIHRRADAERALSAALDADPSHLEALDRLLTYKRASGSTEDSVLGLLARRAEAEADPQTKATLLSEVGERRLAAGEVAAAECALVEATAQAPTQARVDRILSLYPGSPSDGARLLEAVVSRGQALDSPDAGCLAALGRMEIDSLSRWAEGVAHLRLAIALEPAMHEARAALGRGLLHEQAPGEAASLLLSMVVPDPEPLLSLGDPGRVLLALEEAFAAERKHEESMVVRELQAMGGMLDDAAVALLRARRQGGDPTGSVALPLDGRTLRASLLSPQDVPSLLLQLTDALAGADGKLARSDLDALGVDPRERIGGGDGSALVRVAHRLSALLGLTRPELAVTDKETIARIAMVEGPLVVVPRSLLACPEPVQTAVLAGPLVRMALGLPWLDELPGARALALVHAAARQVLPGYAAGPADDLPAPITDEIARRVAKATGRRQRKALSELAPSLCACPPILLADIAALERAVRRAELRAAFVATGDLLATLDAASTLDGTLARPGAGAGAAALATTLRHPLAGDVIRFALAPSSAALRRCAGTLWSPEGRGPIPAERPASAR